MPRRLLSAYWLLTVFLAAGQAGAVGIAGSYSGRYQCREWRAIDLVITDQGSGLISAVFTFPLETGAGSASYSMSGHYDERNGTFQLNPQSWLGRRPPGYNMIGMQGRFDPNSRMLTGKIDNLFCGIFQLAGAGGTPLPQLPPGSPVAPAQGGSPALRSDPVEAGIEYWQAPEDKATPRESEPIDDVIDWLRKEKYSCVGSQHLSWDASGTKGTALDRVNTRARYVIECDGNCRGLRYIVATEAQVQNFGHSKPIPVIQMKGLWFGGTQIRWVFTRPAGDRPPEIYVHQWSDTTFDSGPGCKAPKTNNK